MLTRGFSSREFGQYRASCLHNDILNILLGVGLLLQHDLAKLLRLLMNTQEVLRKASAKVRGFEGQYKILGRPKRSDQGCGVRER